MYSNNLFILIMKSDYHEYIIVYCEHFQVFLEGTFVSGRGRGHFLYLADDFVNIILRLQDLNTNVAPAI